MASIVPPAPQPQRSSASDRSDETQAELADEIQKIVLREVAYVPWGEWFWPTAFRSNVQGGLKALR